jgi:hypothetical protein
MADDETREERDISSAKENDVLLAPASNPTLRFTFNIDIIKDNFCDAMEYLRKLL